MATTTKTKTTPFTFIKTVKKPREVKVEKLEKVEKVEKEEGEVTYMEPFFTCEAAEKVLRKRAQPKRVDIFTRNLF